MKKFNWTLLLAFAAFSIVSCDDDDIIAPENPEENITRVTLIFTPPTGSTTEVVTAVWNDPDGDGTQPPIIDPIKLAPDITYTLDINFSEKDESKTTEIRDEDNEHMIFFGWTEGLFSDPEGNGNIDARGDDNTVVNYEDERDDNGLPLGLKTSWTTSEIAPANSTFTVQLMHQPGTKTATSGTDVGEPDVVATFPISIVD